MKNKDIHKEIDDLFDKFSNTLDVNNFGLYISPEPLNPNDDVEIEQDNETKELDFSWHRYVRVVQSIYSI